MKRAAILLLGTSFLIGFPCIQNAGAKSFRSNQGVAFFQAKQEARRAQSVETASGEADAPLALIEPSVPTPVQPVETPLTVASVNDCTPVTSDATDALLSFYFTALGRIEKTDVGLKIHVAGGALHYNGELYNLTSVEIIKSNPYELKLLHKRDGGKSLNLVVPVVVGKNMNAAFEIFTAQNGTQYLDVNAMLPVSRDYNLSNQNCNEAATLVLKMPVELSASQIEKFKAAF